MLHELFQSVAMQKGTPKTSLTTIRIVIALCVLWARSGESAFFALLTEVVAKYMINKRMINEKRTYNRSLILYLLLKGNLTSF